MDGNGDRSRRGSLRVTTHVVMSGLKVITTQIFKENDMAGLYLGKMTFVVPSTQFTYADYVFKYIWAMFRRWHIIMLGYLRIMYGIGCVSNAKTKLYKRHKT